MYENIDAVQFANEFEEWLDENNPSGTVERSGENARRSSDLLSFINEKQEA